MSGANNPQHAQGAAKKHAYNFGGVLVVAIISIVLGVLYLEENGDYKTVRYHSRIARNVVLLVSTVSSADVL